MASTSSSLKRGGLACISHRLQVKLRRAANGALSDCLTRRSRNWRRSRLSKASSKAVDKNVAAPKGLAFEEVCYEAMVDWIGNSLGNRDFGSDAAVPVLSAPAVLGRLRRRRRETR